MSELRPVFGEIIEDYLRQINERWENMDLEALGVTRENEVISVPLFNLECAVSRTAIETGHSGLLGHSMAVTLSRYLLGPYETPKPDDGQWVSFREFPGSAPFQQGFTNTVERRIAQTRSGQVEQLRQVCLEIGGRETEEEFSHDLVLYMPGLPRVPLLLLFNDEEDGFPAQSTVLFKPSAPAYLDMECIAIMGMVLAALVDPKRDW